MWTTVVSIGLIMATDPIRLGLALVLVTRGRPVLNLLAFWLGGMVAGVILATAVLVLARDMALPVIQAGVSAITEVRSSVAILTGGRLQITLGIIVLLSVVVLEARRRARDRTSVEVGVGAGGGEASGVALQQRPPSLIARMGARAHGMLTQDAARYGGLVLPAFVVGLASSAPPIETVAALTIIMASGATIGTQFSAFLVFIVLVLTVIEIPLVGYLAMPQKTEALMMQMQDWLRTYGWKLTQGLFVVMGSWAVFQGVTSL
jgi:Sap, sulfolipid-1-addressing protein